MEGFFMFQWVGFIFKWGGGINFGKEGGGGFKKNCKMGEGCPSHYGKTLGLEKVDMIIIIIINPLVIKFWSKSIFRQGMLTVWINRVYFSKSRASQRWPSVYIFIVDRNFSTKF